MENLYKKNIALHATVILGLILPLGSIWGPFLIPLHDSQLKSNRKSIVYFQILISLLLFVMGTWMWYEQIELLASSQNLDMGKLYYWALLHIINNVIYPIICIILIYSKRSAYGLYYPKMQLHRNNKG